MIDSQSINLEDLVKSIGIDKDTIIELLGIYCYEMTEEMQQVKLFLEKQEWSDMQRIIHNIKGVSSNLYLQEMFEAAEILELRLKNMDYKGIENSVRNLFDTFNETLNSIHIISNQQPLNSKEV